MKLFLLALFCVIFFRDKNGFAGLCPGMLNFIPIIHGPPSSTTHFKKSLPAGCQPAGQHNENGVWV